tara:strand:- start:686 stop:2269 length:1584 start_codon:yes stop_codon:yes gene_type:complete
MALFVKQKPPTGLLAAYDDNVIVIGQTPGTGVNWNLNNIENFSFGLKLFIRPTDSETTTHSRILLAKPNAEDKGVFNISTTLQDFVSSDKEVYDYSLPAGDFHRASVDGNVVTSTTPHPIHHIDAFSRNKNAMSKCTIYMFITYYDSATNINYSQVDFTEIHPYGAHGGYCFFNGTADYNRVAFGGESYGMRKYLTTFQLFHDNGANRFLSTLAPTTNRKVRSTDHHTFTFLNGKFPSHTSSGTGFGSAADTFTSGFQQLVIKYYTSADVLIDTGVITFTDDLGGDNEANPGTGGFPDVGYEGEGDDDTPNNFANSGMWFGNDNGLYYAGVGPGNLLQDGNYQDSAYYTVQARLDPALAGNNDETCSALYRFDIQDDDCRGYETIRLCWLNRLGGWEYFNFTKKSTRTTNIKRSTFRKTRGNWDGNYYTGNPWDGGTRNFNVDSVENIECNTDYLTEDEAATMEDLFTSPEVYMKVGSGYESISNVSTWESVVVTEKDYTLQTTANDKLKQYILNIEIANKVRVQRI